MFRVAPMTRLNAVVLEGDEHTVLRDLGRLGAIQLTRTLPGPDTGPLAFRDHAADLARYDRLRGCSEELRRSLEIPPSSSGQEPGKMTIDEAEDALRSMEAQADHLLESRRQLVQRQKELTAVHERVSHFCGLDFPLDDASRFSFLRFVTGSLPFKNLEGLEREVGGNVALLPTAQRNGRQALVAVTTREGLPTLEEVLQKAGFQHEALPEIPGSTADALSEEGDRELERVGAELEDVNKRLQTFAAGIAPSLNEIERFGDVECRLMDVSQRLPRTENAVLLSGWVPADDAAAIESRVREITNGRCAFETTPPDNSAREQVPVLLRHSRLLRPFEMLVSTYGLPDYRELEPTLFVALSYLFMFGMMFGDAGHGAVLAACGLTALIAGRSEKARDFGLLLLLGGSASIISGVVYGSYFGIEGLKRYALWRDPLEGDPMNLMYAAIGFGIVMVSLGLILNVINRFRRGDTLGGILDRFGLAGLFFYWGALALIMNGTAIRSRGLMPLMITLFLVVPIVAWIIKEPMEHLLHSRKGVKDEASGGMVGAIMESSVGAFEGVLGYLANTISFVRLAAYAMSHAALLLAAFMLASEVRGLSMGGSFWSVLIIILGNMVAIILEGIIASVQALRLEYYEFFGKFFSGNGQPFEPFRLSGNGRPPGP